MPISNPKFEIALLGGGQLGKMFLAEARRMDIAVRALDPDPAAPCRLGAHHFEVGDFRDRDTVLNFARGAQAAVIEIESVNAEALEILEAEGIPCFPPARALRIIQDKVEQKAFYREHNLATSDFTIYDSAEALREAVNSGIQSLPCVWKLGQGGYDGFGVKVLREASDLADLPAGRCVAEDLVDIDKEIGVVVARDTDGNIESFPPVEMEFHPTANQVEYVVCPASLSDAQMNEASQLAQQCAEAYGIKGLLAVELFLTQSGEWLINEVAPRPHNSGHLTIEGCSVSQFEQLLRMASQLPMAPPIARDASVMANIVGAEGHTGDVHYEGLDVATRIPEAHIHIYGKAKTRPFRKLGHVTALGATVDDARSRAAQVRDAIRAISQTKNP